VFNQHRWRLGAVYLKNASQQGLPFTLNPTMLYRGIGASIMNMGILTGIQFPLTAIASKTVTGALRTPRLVDGQRSHPPAWKPHLDRAANPA
jgi:hypothetical protein